MMQLLLKSISKMCHESQKLRVLSTFQARMVANIICSSQQAAMVAS